MDHLCNPPSFKKILHDYNAPYLALPRDFVMKNEIPEQVVIRSATGGFFWNVKVEKLNGMVCFDKGWTKVLKEAHLCYEDTLVFWLVDETTFKMWIYGTNGCEKVLTPKVHVKVEEVVALSDDDSGHADGDDVGSDGSEGGDGDDTDGIEGGGGGNGGHVDGSDAGCDGSGGGGGDVDGSEGGDNTSDGDRYFTVTISKSHKHCLGLPSHFNGLPGIRHKKDIVMKNLDGKEWDMGVVFRSNQYHVSRGWVGFKRDNNLEEGDECGFLFIKKEGKMRLTRVTKEKKKPPLRAPKVI